MKTIYANINKTLLKRLKRHWHLGDETFNNFLVQIIIDQLDSIENKNSVSNKERPWLD